MLEFIFVVSVVLIIHAYFGYPLSLYLLSKWKGKTFEYAPFGEEFYPTVSVIIAAHNEEFKIIKKLQNTIELNYPTDKLQIIVASDASTDHTDEQVRVFISDHSHWNIEFVRQEENLGKEAAQKLALEHANVDICVFTDVATTLKPNTLLLLTSNFYDKRVGAVDGMSQIVTKDGEVSSEGVYLKYENKIREWESKLGSTVGLGGCLFAARRELLLNFSPVLQSDFRTALQTVTQGYQAIIDTDAVAQFSDLADPSKEASRKHRTTVRGINTFMHHLFLLNPFKYGAFAYQLFCHRPLRWLVPFFMIAAFVSNVFLYFHSEAYIFSVWGFLLSVQFAFYAIAFADISDSNALVKIVKFFVSSNFALLKAWISYAKGERYVNWKPSKR